MGKWLTEKGIVVRSLKEAIVKFIAFSFRETKSPLKLSDPKEMTCKEMDAEKIADERVVPMRLEHVIDNILFKWENKKLLTWADIREVLAAVIANIKN